MHERASHVFFLSVASCERMQPGALVKDVMLEHRVFLEQAASCLSWVGIHIFSSESNRIRVVS